MEVLRSSGPVSPDGLDDGVQGREAVAADELVDVGQGRSHAAGLGREARRRHPRVDPHDPVREAREPRSEEHTSELQSRQYLVCRLLLEKKKKQKNTISH